MGAPDSKSRIFTSASFHRILTTASADAKEGIEMRVSTRASDRMLYYIERHLVTKLNKVVLIMSAARVKVLNLNYASIEIPSLRPVGKDDDIMEKYRDAGVTDSSIRRLGRKAGARVISADFYGPMKREVLVMADQIGRMAALCAISENKKANTVKERHVHVAFQQSYGYHLGAGNPYDHVNRKILSVKQRKKRKEKMEKKKQAKQYSSIPGRVPTPPLFSSPQ